MKLVIQIYMDSDSYLEDQSLELQRAFNRVLEAMPMFPRDEARVIHDRNGNGVGAFEVIEEDGS
jgi:hypothetical protein